MFVEETLLDLLKWHFQVITVRSTSFDAPGEQDASKAAVENIDIPELPKTTEFVSK
mgnify:CR=1 FL=1